MRSLSRTEKIDSLIEYANSEQIPIYYGQLPHAQSLSIYSNEKCYIAIDPMEIKSAADGKVKLAHELGHCETCSFYSRSSPADVLERHEHRADKWAVHHLIPLEEYEEAISKGYTEVWQLAEYFDVTEEFIRRTDYLYRCEGWQGNDITDKEKTEITPEKSSSKPTEPVDPAPQIPQPVSEAPKVTMQKPTQKAEITTLSQLMRFMVQCENKRRNAPPQAKKRVSIDICGER